MSLNQKLGIRFICADSAVTSEMKGGDNMELMKGLALLLFYYCRGEIASLVVH